VCTKLTEFNKLTNSKLTSLIVRLKKANVEKCTADDRLFHIFITRSAEKFFRILQEHWDLNIFHALPLVPTSD